MKFLNTLERKFGRYAIKNLHFYILIAYGAGAMLGVLFPTFYYSYLMLDVGMILHGQVWRIFTFILAPMSMSGVGVFLTVLKMYMFFIFGQALINFWGDFRFNLYILSGYLFNIIAAFILYFVYIAMGYPSTPFPSPGMEYVYESMFFAYAALCPNAVFFMSFLIPIKAKWLAIISGIEIAVGMISAIRLAIQIPIYWSYPVSLFAAMLNFLIFFLATRDYKKISPAEIRRKSDFKKKIKYTAPLIHRCAVCGRTPMDSNSLEFRFCSKCKGNYEYCNEHLFTHEHVK